MFGRGFLCFLPSVIAVSLVVVLCTEVSPGVDEAVAEGSAAVVVDVVLPMSVDEDPVVPVDADGEAGGEGVVVCASAAAGKMAVAIRSLVIVFIGVTHWCRRRFVPTSREIGAGRR